MNLGSTGARTFDGYRSIGRFPWTQAQHTTHGPNGLEILLPFLPVVCCSGRPCFFPAARAARARLLPRRVPFDNRCNNRSPMSHLLQQIKFSPENHSYAHLPPPIVANDSTDLFKQTHGGGASSSRLLVRRLDRDLAAANSRRVPISVHGVAEERSTISSFFQPMLATKYYRT